jgi:protein-tyrosine-phosphatase
VTIHFICRGNVNRSLIAETYLTSLRLTDVDAKSSGTHVDLTDETEHVYYLNTVKLLKRHGIDANVKPGPEQLTQERIDQHDITICMNQRVRDEARAIVALPKIVTDWDITDIGEGDRIATNGNLYQLEEVIYQEITTKVDALVNLYVLN